MTSFLWGMDKMCMARSGSPLFVNKNSNSKWNRNVKKIYLARLELDKDSPNW